MRSDFTSFEPPINANHHIILRTCAYCGCEYWRRHDRPGRFCSHSCGNHARAIPLEQRFWTNVQKSDECWIWTGLTDNDGYGLVWGGPSVGQSLRAHRVAYEMTYGPIPQGMVVCHRCDNPPCIRPDHLFLGTVADNNADAQSKGRLATGERSGLHTHPERRSFGDANGSRRFPERLRRGEAVTNSKLTEAQVVEIRARYANGESQTSIARAFGIAPTNVARIVKREGWKHV